MSLSLSLNCLPHTEQNLILFAILRSQKLPGRHHRALQQGVNAVDASNLSPSHVRLDIGHLLIDQLFLRSLVKMSVLIIQVIEAGLVNDFAVL